MNSTILLSTQRSGTTFFDRKLNGMLDLKTGGGELIDFSFYDKHDVKNLIKCDNFFDKNKHLKLREDNHADDFEDDCYVEVNKHLLTSAVKKSDYAEFNVMLNAIKYNIDLIKSIKTPILFLIRKNNWKRCVSESVMQDTKVSHIMKNSEFFLDVKLNKEKIIKNCETSYEKIVAFQKELKNQKNVKIIYYEDIQNKEYWTDEFINELEDFMKVKFTDRNYIPPFKKTRNFVNIINEAETVDEEMIKKYYIKEI
tara:strand:- start:274 stop:1035 length:762 start_codon:yes stop_codon:yes gene_type:complete